MYQQYLKLLGLMLALGARSQSITDLSYNHFARFKRK